jgi:hypothetical protein
MKILKLQTLQDETISCEGSFIAMPQMMGQNQQQQPTMMQPPQVITTKDSMYLKDQMSWLLLAIKKCRHFAGECQDQAIAQAIDRIGQLHERQYALLLKHCNTNNTLAMMNLQQQQQTQQQPQQ